MHPSRSLLELHVSRAARDRYAFDAALVRTDGSLILADPAAARRVSAAMAEAREAAGLPPAEAGELFAAGLIHEILHRVVHLYREEVDPDAFVGALATLDETIGRRAVDETLDAFNDRFPTAAAYRDEDETPLTREAALEELLLVWLANANPALDPFRELFDDGELASSTAYERVIAGVAAHFASRPPFGPDAQPLVAMLRAPAIAVPDSIHGQLEYIRERWARLLGDLLARLLLSMDVLDEEGRARWQRFNPWPGGAGGGGTPGALAGFGGLEGEPERFSADREWMPRLVLMAKSSYVWLDQLSRVYERDIRTLDAIPDEELDRLARWGVTGLWLIGLWQRSRASERIKRIRGNPEAVASAYSLDEYRIADDLGGEAAWQNLRERAWARGIRLASDMVPNHMGIDSRWVADHPERFLSLPYSPYPGYSYTGADLSDDPRVAIRIDDHYWDGTDAAVVFQRVDTASGDVRYIYHGNDGTSMPWNDTAQLDYLDPGVREAVISTILDVARHFPIIRFDAAMTLAKKHIERLWYPVPGAGGSIPSRAEHAMSREDFEAAMPQEFWREVVDRVAAEAPDTLLLAEAFWLMEGYFVRSLGMHRVYNSAFMHMLRDEDNAGYRSVIRNTLEFDPEILKRYVNFMNNPDEKTAVEQFGKGDKYFGVATVLATLPGLPMLGHGQVEGFAEKYGMEFRRAYQDETADQWLVERHERELFPLLHRRGQFAEARDFLLFDLVRDDGSVDEDVYAYSNGQGSSRSLVVYHNRFAETAGTIQLSAASSEPDGSGGRRLTRRTLGEGWGLPYDETLLVRFRDQVTGLEHLHRATAIRDRGLRLHLHAYERHVFLDVTEVRDGAAGLWGRLADRLDGRGVPSLEGAFRELELEPVHVPVRALLGADLLGALASAATGETSLPEWVGSEVERRLREVMGAVREATGSGGGTDDAAIAAGARLRIERIVDLAGGRLPKGEPAAGPAALAKAAVLGQLTDPGDRMALFGWALLEPIGRAGEAADHRATSRAWIGELRLSGVVADAFRSVGLDEATAWRAAERLRLLVDLPRPLTVGVAVAAAAVPAAIVTAALGNDDIRSTVRVNRWEGVEWFEREAFEALIDSGFALDAIDAPWLAPERALGRANPVAWAIGASERVGLALKRAGEESGYRVDRLIELAAALRVPEPRGRGRRTSAPTGIPGADGEVVPTGGPGGRSGRTSAAKAKAGSTKAKPGSTKTEAGSTRAQAEAVKPADPTPSEKTVPKGKEAKPKGSKRPAKAAKRASGKGGRKGGKGGKGKSGG
jgi:glycosidase